MILAPLQKVAKNVGDLGKLIVAKGFKKLPKVQKIANSGHTDTNLVPARKSARGCVTVTYLLLLHDGVHPPQQL